MDFGIEQVVSLFDTADFAVAIVPIPDRYGYSCENEVRCIAGNVRYS
jgi:hypothetical protein